MNCFISNFLFLLFICLFVLFLFVKKLNVASSKSRDNLLLRQFMFATFSAIKVCMNVRQPVCVYENACVCVLLMEQAILFFCSIV